MRRLAAAAALLLAACSGSSTKKLALLHTNDEHSHMLGYGPESDDFPAPTTAGVGAIKGGAARRAVMLKAEKLKAQAAGYDVLTVSAGDNAMGTLEQVAFALQGADFRLMRLLGYDITTFGNHEFDYGPGPLAGAIAAAKSSNEGLPVIVSSNIAFSGTAADAPLQALFDEVDDAGKHQDSARPVHRSWVITTSSGLKVGFVGITGVNASQKAPLKAPTRFSQAPGVSETDTLASLAALFNDVQRAVDSLHKNDHVDLVIALSHSGVDLTTPALGEDTQIAQNVAGIDVIISGHTHSDYPAKLETNLRTGKKVLVQQAGRFGDQIGRIQLSVKDGQVSFETDQSALIKIDDTIVPDGSIAGFVSGVIGSLESTKIAALGNKSFLEYEVSLTYGAALTDDSGTVGDLAFKGIGKGTFAVQGEAAQKESALLRLTADADLKAAEAIGLPTDLGVQAAGVLRADLQPNKKGEFSFSDVFRVVPLGASPANSSLGYPLTRFGIFLAELKAAFEVSAGLAQESDSNGDYFIVPSGFCFTYDTSRPEFSTSGSTLDPTNGRVTKIFRSTDHSTPDKLNACDQQLFDATNPAVLTASGGTGYMVHPLTMYVATTNLYVATFAYLAGVKLKDPANSGKVISPTDAIVHRPPPLDQAEIKEWEALGNYVRALSAGGDLPAAYKKDAGTFRAKCSGPLCK